MLGDSPGANRRGDWAGNRPNRIEPRPPEKHRGPVAEFLLDMLAGALYGGALLGALVGFIALLALAGS